MERSDGTLDSCRVPGKGKSFGMPVPGDFIRYNLPTATQDGWVEEILPRSSLFQRFVFGRIKEIAANMDRVLLIVTPSEPTVSPRLLDRMLVGASVGNLEVVIVVNKMDILKQKDVEAWLEPWKIAGYSTVTVSAREQTGLLELENHLKDKVCLLAGASGVGKSTILNKIIENLNLNTTEISNATGRGVHTTTFTQLYRFGDSGIVADSPGIREFYPAVEPDNLAFHFPEFQQPAEECEFHDCLHLEEPNCGVIVAVEEGRIHPQRYESYGILYQSLKEGPRRGRAPGFA
ncbi:ribosome small subunit-dependent GTPase A [bacterium]|nr:ribosome small subunit-dependent GTPase A [bacterium]